MIIATDDMRIAEAAFDWGAEVALTSANIAAEQIGSPKSRRKRSSSRTSSISGDEPLIDPKLIDRLVRELQRDRKLEMITAAHPFDDPRDAESPHQVKVVLDSEGRRSIFLARADSLQPAATSTAASNRRSIFSPSGHLRLPRDLLLRFVPGNRRRSSEPSRSSNCAHLKMV